MLIRTDKDFEKLLKIDVFKEIELHIQEIPLPQTPLFLLAVPGRETSKAGDSLIANINDQRLRTSALVGVSGCGKSRAIQDAARKYYCCFFLPKQSRDLQSMEIYSQELLEHGESDAILHLVSLMVASRWFILWCISRHQQVSPEQWFCFQNMNESQNLFRSVFTSFCENVACRQFYPVTLLGFVAFDEVQVYYNKDPLLVKRADVRSPRAPFFRIFIRAAENDRIPHTVIAGTALGIGSIQHIYSGINKMAVERKEQLRGSIIVDFDYFKTEFIQELLSVYEVVDDVVFESVEYSKAELFLQGRARTCCRFVLENLNKRLNLEDFMSKVTDYISLLVAEFSNRILDLHNDHLKFYTVLGSFDPDGSKFPLTGPQIVANMLAEAEDRYPELGSLDHLDPLIVADFFEASKIDGVSEEVFDLVAHGFALSFNRKFYVTEPIVIAALQQFIAKLDPSRAQEYCSLLSERYAAIFFDASQEPSSRGFAFDRYICVKFSFDIQSRIRLIEKVMDAFADTFANNPNHWFPKQVYDLARNVQNVRWSLVSDDVAVQGLVDVCWNEFRRFTNAAGPDGNWGVFYFGNKLTISNQVNSSTSLNNLSVTLPQNMFLPRSDVKETSNKKRRKRDREGMLAQQCQRNVEQHVECGLGYVTVLFEVPETGAVKNLVVGKSQSLKTRSYSEPDTHLVLRLTASDCFDLFQDKRFSIQ